VPAFFEPVSRLRRFLFASAGVYTLISVALLAYWLFIGKSMVSLVAPVFDAVDTLPAFFAMLLTYIVGFFLSANLIIELIRIFRPSTRTWTDGRHLKMVVRLLLGSFEKRVNP
jgi:hypothetical protein